MSDGCIISVDLMGGDFGAHALIPGASRFLETNPDTRFLLYGDEKVCLPLLDFHKQLKHKSTFHHCDVSIAMDEKPREALRRGRNVSSMWCAIEAVKKKQASAVLTAGNTAVLIPMARFCLSKISGIDRPSLIAFWPTVRGQCIVLDVGASMGADVSHMIQLSILGGAFVRAVWNEKRPSVGLLNLGSEETKGHEVLREASRLLREHDFGNFEYKGFIEASDISNGFVDVVVAEGFSGNIAIKAAEGAARRIADILKESLSRTLLSRIGCFFAKNALKEVKDKMDPRNFNGGVLLGVDGLVVKGHGSGDSKSIFNALHIAKRMSQSNFIDTVKTDIQRSHYSLSDISGKEAISEDRKKYG
ncbi:phosphate acyltransferase PlsX [Candidatus Liberibacter sp.]|uniref:phosphate acyltransferase PlsX n=1 Tax=Candidatus Liberibacter sp. TaxID=34022 RepID=UPI0015F4FB42|nr:phosphate acyltransferase PlsX [Candidatus Liberibacter sp.]MBA5724193.1 phosphate acyltransferase PlsX [Candidatus Liberibacter sp.]